MRWAIALVALVACKKTAAEAPQVHAANLIEIGGAPGEVKLTATGNVGGKTAGPVTATLPSFPWNGRTVAAVPVLPVKAGDSWTLTYQSVPARTVTLVPTPVSGTPGAATLAFLDQLAKLDTTLHPPA